MAVLPEVVSSTAEITIDDIQVGDPGIPLSQDQEKLRQLIYKSRHLLIGKGNSLPLQHEELYVILMSVEQDQSRNECDPSRLNFVRNWLI